MRVVVLGPAGQLGREVVCALLARGHTVRAAASRMRKNTTERRYA
jgi:uncharacterized protein YbjT (DUF2867 family)